METENADLTEHIRRLALLHDGEPGSILNILCQIQDEYRHIPIEAAFELSRVTGEPFAEICAIISAFDEFDTEPVGKHLILVCNGTACHAKGSEDIISALETVLDVRCGHTREDGEFTLKAVHCIGACSLAPIIQVDGVDEGRVRLSDVSHLLETIRFEEREADPS